MAPFPLCFGVLKVKKTNIHTKFSECFISASKWRWRTSLQMKWCIVPWIFYMMELKATNKTCLERKGMLRLTQMMRMVLVVTVIIKKKYWRKQMNPEDWVAGGVVLEKCFDVVVLVEGYEGDKHKCWWRTGMRQLYFYVSAASVWFYLKLCPVILKVVK